MTRTSRTLPSAIADCSGCLRGAVGGLFFHGVRSVFFFAKKSITNGDEINFQFRWASKWIAWNAFCEGRDLKIIKCIEDAPIVIWGTPVKAKK